MTKLVIADPQLLHEEDVEFLTGTGSKPDSMLNAQISYSARLRDELLSKVSFWEAVGGKISGPGTLRYYGESHKFDCFRDAMKWLTKRFDEDFPPPQQRGKPMSHTEEPRNPDTPLDALVSDVFGSEAGLRVDLRAWIDWREPPATKEQAVRREYADQVVRQLAFEMQDPVAQILMLRIAGDAERKEEVGL